ncbi:YadA-like family protein [Burkholderia contaminans]|uniref:YadA-like family protein n=1 Tax=Burkholderia contaminans TaxID=488447 RepID=UPI001583465F|nr:YadA-like family protein [Burkholderia contaminans]
MNRTCNSIRDSLTQIFAILSEARPAKGQHAPGHIDAWPDHPMCFAPPIQRSFRIGAASQGPCVEYKPCCTWVTRYRRPLSAVLLVLGSHVWSDAIAGDDCPSCQPSTANADLTTSIASLSTSITGIAHGENARGELINLQLVDLRSALNSLSTSISTGSSELAPSGSVTSPPGRDVMSLSTGLSSTVANVASLSSGLSTVGNHVDVLSTGLNAGLNTVGTRVASLSTSLNATSSNVASLSSGLSTVGNRVDALSTGLNSGLKTVGIRADSLSTTLNATSSTVATLSSGLSTTGTRVDTLSIDLKDTNTSLASLSSNLESTNRTVSSLSTSVSTAAIQSMSGVAADTSGTAAQRPQVSAGSNSVALGAYATNNSRDNVVSVGNSSMQRQIINVAPGTDGADAVNVNQLNAVSTTLTRSLAVQQAQINNLGALTEQTQQRLQQTDKMAKEGISAVGAMASVPALDQNARFGIGIGTATFLGQKAIALNMQARITDNIKGSVSGGISGSQKVVGAGVLYQWK